MPHGLSSSLPPQRVDTTAETSLVHAMPGVSRLMVAPHPGASLSTSRSNNGDIPSSGALWRMAVVNPQPPHLVALSFHRPWPVELSWRRSKPLTRRLTTTVTATTALQGKAIRQSKSSGRAQSLPRGPVTRVNVVPVRVETDVTGAKQSRVDASPLSHVVVAPSEQRLSVSFPQLPSSPLAPDSSFLITDGDAEISSPVPMAATCRGRADTPKSAPGAAVDVPTAEPDLFSTSAPHFAGTTAVDTSCTPSKLLYKADAPQSDYARTHRLPQLFSEMVRDLAMAQPQSTAPDSDESGVVMQWIQHWFRNRYDRAQASPESASFPSHKSAQNCATLNLRAREDDTLLARPCDPRSRSKPVSASTSAARSAVSSSASSSIHRFVPLAVQPTGTAAIVGNGGSASADDAPLCTSLNSAGETPDESHPLPLLLPSPQHTSPPTSASPVQHSPAAVAPKPTHSGRPPQPSAHPVVNAAKISGGNASNMGGAAVTGPGRKLAMPACAIVGLRTLVSAPEAAQNK
ncbi:hypothetical protein ABL78_6337 [Leptomonas seymouri]|uniref:Uncharacterized protein n=1 Tax=Leptomonas seymouri TaxID=5684 RepID=A0A0N1I0Y8_LEPSE|nr:hypothetical protein ABL78_6337 [Leptomonas seymouri]|eukprot:KPI84605.1 hypothetical protein ABL78_6337 [Leptomonas seymouri]